MDLSVIYTAKAMEYLLAVAYVLIVFPFFSYVTGLELPGMPGKKTHKSH